MRTILVTVSVVMASATLTHSQGKISFANDSLHLVYYTSDTGLLRPGDAALAGQAVSSSTMPAGLTLVVDLYAGTSSTSLSLITTTTFGSTAGRFVTANVNLPIGFPGGTTAFFQVQIRDNAFATGDAGAAGGSLTAKSIIFTAVPGSSIAYNSLVNLGSPAFSTWAVGTYDMSNQTGLPGARGAIMLALIPEPGFSAFVVAASSAFLGWRAWRRYKP